MGTIEFVVRWSDEQGSVNFWNARKLTSIPDEQLTQAHVDAARIDAEAAHDEVLRLVDPKHPRYQSFSRASERLRREVEDAEQLARLRRVEWQMLADRFEAKLRRERTAREEEFLRRRVEASEDAARHARHATATRAATSPQEATPMTPESTALQQRQALRLKMLLLMYERSEASTSVKFVRETMFLHLQVSPAEGQKALDYLVHERLVQWHGKNVALTHTGLTEAEATIERKPTPHFAPLVINMAFNGAVGAVQTGPNATATVRDAGAPPTKDDE